MRQFSFPTNRTRPRTWYVPVSREVYSALEEGQPGFVGAGKSGNRWFASAEIGDLFGFFDELHSLSGEDVTVLYRRIAGKVEDLNLYLALEDAHLPDGALIPAGRALRGYSAADFWTQQYGERRAASPSAVMVFDPRYDRRKVA